MLEINAVELEEGIKEDIVIGNVPMIASSPGMGKSDIVRSVAKSGNFKVIDLRISQCEPVDMQGYPGVTPEGRMTFHTPEYFPLESDPILKDIMGGFFSWMNSTLARSRLRTQHISLFWIEKSISINSILIVIS